jgi:cell division GTPase FtsZ
VLTELREELDTVLSLSNEDLMSLFTEDHRMIDTFSSVSEIWKGVAVAATSRGVAVQ